MTLHPADQTVTSGRSATLRVDATGAASLTYQWYRGVNGSTIRPITGATSQEFTTPSLSGTTRYWAQVSNTVGIADSETATVTVEEPAPAGSPSLITLQPADRTINTGASTLLKVRAKRTAPLRYQWYRGQRGSISRPVAGATLKDYTTPHLTETMKYWARIINPHGTVDSATATITVNVPTPSPEPDPDPVDTSSTFEQ